MRRGVATFTLDHGRCPKWLFDRMVKLGGAMTEAIVEEHGPKEFIKRLGDPVWFQSLGTVLAFDWNASGLTTILTAALKEAVRGREQELGIFICGGKGATSRRTPQQIKDWAERIGLEQEGADALEYNSRMSAKVDSALVQDGYQLYHHAFFFTSDGAWTVVQQGMNEDSKTARRYHWHAQSPKDFINEPHAGIASQRLLSAVRLNLTDGKSGDNREASLEILRDGYQRVMGDFKLLDSYLSQQSAMVEIANKYDHLKLIELDQGEFRHHPVERESFSKSRHLQKIFSKLSVDVPENYEKLVITPGVGPKTLRALSLVGEVIYGAKASRRDPARYSFAHGGKDATPYPVDTKTYDRTIQLLRKALKCSRIDTMEKRRMLARLPQA